jgi:hypothetical protein
MEALKKKSAPFVMLSPELKERRKLMTDDREHSAQEQQEKNRISFLVRAKSA